MRVLHSAIGQLTTLCAVLALSALSFQCTVIAAENGFQVTSYTQKYFSDFTWYVQGAGSYNWSDQSLTPVNHPFSYQLSQTSDNRFSQSSASGNTYLQYRYETIQRVATVGCRLYGSVSGSKNTGYQNSVDTTRDRQSYNSENSGHTFYLQANPSLSLTNYLSEEFLVGVDLSGYVNYQRYPKYKSTNSENSSSFPDSQSSYYYVTYRDDNTSEQPRTYKSYSFDGELTAGWGHIYSGRFAAATIYLVNELRNNGFIKQEPTESQMLELTEIVNQQKLKHAVDYRIRLIEAQQTIMNYLKAQQIATTENPLMSLVFQDVWNYFPSYDRAFGFQVRGGIGLEYERSSTDRTLDASDFHVWKHYHRDTVEALSNYPSGSILHLEANSRYTTTLPYLFWRASYQKPIDLRWQLDIGADARLFISPSYVDRFNQQLNERRWYTITEGTDTTWDTSLANYGDVSNFAYKNMYTANLNGSLRYIYDSRTSALLSAELGYGHLDQQLTITERQLIMDDSTKIVERKYTAPTYSSVRFALSLAMTYRLSIPTTVNASISYYTGNNPRNVIPSYYKYKPQNFSISATITHYLY